MHPLECLALELLHPRPCDPERDRDRVRRRRVVAGQAEPADDHLTLARRQPAEQRADGMLVDTTQGLGGILGVVSRSSSRSGVPSPPTGSSSEAIGRRDPPQMLDVGSRHVERVGELRGRRCSADLHAQFALESLQAPQAGVGVGR